MKALKNFGWFLLAGSVCLYLMGIFSGEFFKSVGGLLYYGTSMKALWLSVLSAGCLFLSVVAFLVLAIKKKKG